MTNHPLLAAAKEIDITPPVGSKLEGYIARKENSRGIHDPLMGAVLLIQVEKQTIALISLDYLALSTSTARQIRESVSLKINIPVQNIMVACTHTHSGPAGLPLNNPLLNQEKDSALEEMLVRKLSGAASWAYDSIQPAMIRVGHDSLNALGKNRNSPDNPLDSQLTVMTIENFQGEIIAIWANFGCHPTILGSDNLYISADFPGAARQILKQIYPGMVWLFANGASGDVSTRFTRRGQGFEEVGRFGKLLAGSVLRAIQLANPIIIDHIQCLIEPVSIPVRDFPPREQAALELKSLTEVWEKLTRDNATASQMRIAQTRVEGAQAQLLMSKGFGNKKNMDSEIQLIQLGDLALITLPGEPFTRTVLEIKKQSPFALTSVVSYANDYLGYFPDEESVKMGTYEALVSPFKPGAAEILRDAVLKLLEKGLARGY